LGDLEQRLSDAEREQAVVSRPSGQNAPQRRRRVPRFTLQAPGKVALVAEAEFSREPREVALATRDSFQRGAHAEADAVSRDGLSGVLTKDSAEVVGRNGQFPGQVEKRPVWLARQ
jgi:hypothetical protein